MRTPVEVGPDMTDMVRLPILTVTISVADIVCRWSGSLHHFVANNPTFQFRHKLELGGTTTAMVVDAGVPFPSSVCDLQTDLRTRTHAPDGA